MSSAVATTSQKIGTVRVSVLKIAAWRRAGFAEAALVDAVGGARNVVAAASSRVAECCFMSANMLLILAASLLRLRRLCKRRCVRPRAARNGSQTPPASMNSVLLRPPRPPSPPAPQGGRGPGRGAPGPFANQKNRRAQNDLGRRPSTPQKRGAVDQGHSAATERTQALDDEPRRPARTRCSAARRSFKGQFDSQHRRRYRASRVLEPRPAPPSKRRHQRAPRDARAGPEAPPRVARRSAPTTVTRSARRRPKRRQSAY